MKNIGSSGAALSQNWYTVTVFLCFMIIVYKGKYWGIYYVLFVLNFYWRLILADAIKSMIWPREHYTDYNILNIILSTALENILVILGI